MFWKFGGYNNTTCFDTLLAKSDLKLQQVLDETSVLEEVKQENAKLVEYLRKDDVLEELTKLALAPLPNDADVSDEKTTPTGSFFGMAKGKDRSKSRGSDEANEESDDKKALKYAYLATEILSSEVWSITEALVGNPKHMNLFWEFLKQPAPLESQQAGYFTKIVENLLDKKTEDTLAFFKSLNDFVPVVCQHVDCPVVMDLLLKIISLERSEAGQGVVDWLQVNGLIPTLLSYISPEHNAATQTSAGDFLKAIITISANATTQDQSVIGPNELTRELVSEPQVQTLIGMMLHGGNPLTVGVGIIIEVIRKNNSDYDPENQVGPEPKSSDPIYLGTLLRLFALRVPDFMKLLQDRYHTVTNVNGTKTLKKRELNIASGEKIEPLGFDRFKTCELMAELLHCSNMALLNEKGSEHDIKLRDAERERLKACGKLRAARNLNTETEQGVSVDSSGYNKATLDDSPLSSPTSSDEDFEKVVYLSDDKTGEATIYTKLADFCRSKQVETPSSSSHSQLLRRGQDPELVDAAVVSNEPLVERSSLEDAMESSISSANEDMSSPTSTHLSRSVHGLALKDDYPMTGAESSALKRDDEEYQPKTSFKRSKSAVTLTDFAQASTAEIVSVRPKLYKKSSFDLGPDPDSTEHVAPESTDDPLPSHLVASNDSTSSLSARDGQKSYLYNDRKQGYLRLHGICEPKATVQPLGQMTSITTPAKNSPKSNMYPRKATFLIGPDDSSDDDDDSDDVTMTSGRAADAHRGTHEGYETSERNTEEEVVGDLLKRMFVENKVVPTVLDMFFRFPWNNFLHNVVYDIIQQVFNGQIDNGQNRRLAIDLFETGHITSRIIQGQRDSDLAQAKTNVRLGYMGHLTLISEEVVKFSERHEPESLSLAVHHSLTNPEWIDYVEQKLSETRDRDNAVLGGVRPDPSGMPGIPGHLSLNPLSKWGNVSSSALANAGLTGNGPADPDELEGAEIGENGSADSAGLLGGYGGTLYRGDEMEEGGNTSGVHFADDTERSVSRSISSQSRPIFVGDVESWEDLEDGACIELPDFDDGRVIHLTRN